MAVKVIDIIAWSGKKDTVKKNRVVFIVAFAFWTVRLKAFEELVVLETNIDCGTNLYVSATFVCLCSWRASIITVVGGCFCNICLGSCNASIQ